SWRMRSWNTGSCCRRYAVRSLTPALRAALSTVAPQASAMASVWSAFFLPRAIPGLRSSGKSRSALSSDLGYAGSWPLPLGDPAGEALPALDNDIDVERIDFHDEGAASGLLGRDQGAPRAPEQIQHVLASAGTVLHRPEGQLDRLLG